MRVGGVTDALKSPADVIVRLTGVSWITDPLVPRIVTVNVPAGVDALLTNVNVEEAEPFAVGVTVDGLKAVPARTVPGKLSAVRFTGLLKPPVLVIVIA